MKKLIYAVIITLIISSSYSFAGDRKLNQLNGTNTLGAEKELFILLTSGDIEVFNKMVAPYLNVSAKSWEKRTLLIWGPSEKLIAENSELAETVKKLKESGVVLKACKWCADQYKVGDALTKLGFEVAYMGTPLTEALQSNMKVMIF